MKMIKHEDKLGVTVYYPPNSPNLTDEILRDGELVTVYQIDGHTYFDYQGAERAAFKLWLKSGHNLSHEESVSLIRSRVFEYYNTDERIDRDFLKRYRTEKFSMDVDETRSALKRYNELTQNPNNLVYMASAYTAMGEGSTTWILVTNTKPNRTTFGGTEHDDYRLMFTDKFGVFAAWGMKLYEPYDFFDRYEVYLPDMVKRHVVEDMKVGAYSFSTEFYVNFG